MRKILVRKILVFAAAATLTAIALPAARADTVTYAFTGTVTGGLAGLVGQTLQGTLHYDVDLAAFTDLCCTLGTVAQSQYATTAAGAPAYAQAVVTFSGGLSLATGNGLLSNYGYSEVIKQAGEEGSPGPLNRFSVQTQSNDTTGDWRAIALFTSDRLGAASTMFPQAGAGLANDQRVNWNTPGALSFGTVMLGSGGVGQTLAEFRLDSIALVPEPPSAALLLAGMLLLGAGRRATRQR